MWETRFFLTTPQLIIKTMARGWESKSVESQMDSANDKAAGSGRARSDAEKRVRHEIKGLELSRAYVLRQIESSTNERYTQSLQQALSEIDGKLAKLAAHR